MDEVTHLSWQGILQWYNNHTHRTSTGDGKRKKILDLRGKRHRKLADWQAYSRLYYNDRIKDVVDREWEAKTKAFMKSHAEGDESAVPVLTMVFHNKITRRIFAGESAEIKAECEKYHDQEAMGGAADVEINAEAARVAKAQSYHESVGSRSSKKVVRLKNGLQCSKGVSKYPPVYASAD